jgi:hypothetical protein
MKPEFAVEKDGKRRWRAGFVLGKLPSGQPVIDSWSPPFSDTIFKSKPAAIKFIERVLATTRYRGGLR